MLSAVNDESDRTAMTVNLIHLSRVPCAAVRTLPYAGIAVVSALALAACGPSSGSGDAGAPAGASTPAPTGAAGGGAGGQRPPGVNGLVAAVSGSTMEVQTRTDQTAVTWNNSTTFTTTASATLADVTVGACVTVLEPASSGSATTSGSGSAPATQVTAASVDVRPAVNGQCTGFGGAGGAGGPGGVPGSGATRPSGAPTAPPTTGAAGGRGSGDVGRRALAGQVTAVSGDTITVQETLRPRGTDTATATATPTIATVTVTTNASTTYTAQKTGAASDVTVGECASALGKADDTGAVTATSISLRPATNGSCTTGFGGAGGGGGGATGTATTGGSNG
jgi:hypothetical protein